MYPWPISLHCLASLLAYWSEAGTRTPPVQLQQQQHWLQVSSAMASRANLLFSQPTLNSTGVQLPERTSTLARWNSRQPSFESSSKITLPGSGFSQLFSFPLPPRSKIREFGFLLTSRYSMFGLQSGFLVLVRTTLMVSSRPCTSISNWWRAWTSLRPSRQMTSVVGRAFWFLRKQFWSQAVNMPWKRAEETASLLLTSLQSVMMWVRSVLVVPTKPMKAPCLPFELAMPAIANFMLFSFHNGWQLGTDHSGCPIFEFICRMIFEAKESTFLVLLARLFLRMICDGQLKLVETNRLRSAQKRSSLGFKKKTMMSSFSSLFMLFSSATCQSLKSRPLSTSTQYGSQTLIPKVFEAVLIWSMAKSQSSWSYLRSLPTEQQKKMSLKLCGSRTGSLRMMLPFLMLIFLFGPSLISGASSWYPSIWCGSLLILNISSSWLPSTPSRFDASRIRSYGESLVYGSRLFMIRKLERWASLSPVRVSISGMRKMNSGRSGVGMFLANFIFLLATLTSGCFSFLTTQPYLVLKYSRQLISRPSFAKQKVFLGVIMNSMDSILQTLRLPYRMSTGEPLYLTFSSSSPQFFRSFSRVTRKLSSRRIREQTSTCRKILPLQGATVALYPLQTLSPNSLEALSLSVFSSQQLPRVSSTILDLRSMFLVLMLSTWLIAGRSSGFSMMKFSMLISFTGLSSTSNRKCSFALSNSATRLSGLEIAFRPQIMSPLWQTVLISFLRSRWRVLTMRSFSALLFAGSSGEMSRENWQIGDAVFFSLISQRFEQKLVRLPSFDTVRVPFTDLGSSCCARLCVDYIIIIARAKKGPKFKVCSKEGDAKNPRKTPSPIEAGLDSMRIVFDAWKGIFRYDQFLESIEVLSDIIRVYIKQTLLNQLFRKGEARSGGRAWLLFPQLNGFIEFYYSSFSLQQVSIKSLSIVYSIILPSFRQSSFPFYKEYAHQNQGLVHEKMSLLLIFRSVCCNCSISTLALTFVATGSSS